jgi:glycosyltransferase involved in cell wall biosynthesis
MAQDSGPLVSVVTPCYNTAEYLRECMDSIANQTFGNWEHIFLDNCSTDDSLAIAQDYASRDHRITVHTNTEFLSQVDNYNRALSLISPASRYVKVVEPDNWLFRTCLEDMVQLAEKYPRIGIVSAYSMTESELRFRGLSYRPNVLDGTATARKHFLQQAYLFGSPTTVLMSADEVRANQPFYDPNKLIAEDLSACWQILRERDFGFVHQVLTFVRKSNEGSILSGRKGMDAMSLDRMIVLVRHGRDFLGEDEYLAAYRTTRRGYYSKLAAAFLGRREQAYWDLHERGLKEIGLRIERGALAWHVLLIWARAIANPGSSVMALLRNFRRRIAGRIG